MDSNFDLMIFKGSYGYSFFTDDRFDLGVSAGLFVMPSRFDIRAQGSIELDESESITAPLPVLGLSLDFAFTPKLFLKNNFDVFYISIDQFTGSIVDREVALEYNAYEHIGFGVVFNSFRLGIEADGGGYPGIDLNGRIDFVYTGLLLYGKFYY